MQKTIIAMTALGSVMLLVGAAGLPADVKAEEMSDISAGKQIAFDRKKGNCLACHVMDDGDLAGNIGPPLVAMQARFPDKAMLRAQIWDATQKNPNTMMPPFGRHKILSEDDIDKIADYVHTL